MGATTADIDAALVEANRVLRPDGLIGISFWVPAVAERILVDGGFDVTDHCRDTRGSYRFRNDHHFVIARKSARRGVWVASQE